jgi:molybdopterin converting factor small subunit
MLIEMMTLTVGKTIPPQADAKAYYSTLEEEYKQKLRHIERTSRDTVQSVYQHYQVQREDADAAALVSSVVEGDLFATETWRLFGQTRWRLAMLGAASGATVGGIVDASVGGASVLLGTVIGATVGGALGWHAAEWSSNFRLLTLPGIDALALGGKYLQCGPTTNRNLPYVALGRARWHHRLIALRTHAQRNVIRLDTVPQQAGGMPPLEESEERALEHLFAEIRKAAGSERVWDMVEEVRAVVQRLLERDEQS